MSDDLQTWTIRGILAAAGTLISGIALYNFKKVQDIPEKYISKYDFNIAKNEIRQDIKGVHDRLDKLFEPK